MPMHILVVDDERPANAFLAEYLTQLGYDVASAYNGVDALRQMHHRPPELAVVDLQMPGMGGWELVRQVRADSQLSHVPIIVCTGRTDARLPADLVQGIVYKPYRLEDLAGQVMAALTRPAGSGTTSTP